MELTTQTLHDLSALQTNGHRILSVYLDVDPATGNLLSYPVVFRDQVRTLETELDDAARAGLQAEARRVQRFLEREYQREGKGLIIFSSEPAGVWQVYQTAVPVPNRVHLDSEPYLRPLVQLLDDLERVAVLLVDKEQARLYTLRLAEIEDASEVFDEVPGKHKQGGWSQANFQRHHEAAVQEHLKHVLTTLQDFGAEHPFQRLILGGPQEALTEFRALLPQELAPRVIGTISTPLFADADEVRQAALGVAQQWEQEDEARRVQEVLEGAAMGGRAVVGWAETLRALQEGKVWRLLVAEDFTAPLIQCTQCGYVTPDDDGICPTCGGALAAAEDGVNRAIRMALAQGGQVEVVSGQAAATLLEHGGVGAIVRF